MRPGASVFCVFLSGFLLAHGTRSLDTAAPEAPDPARPAVVDVRAHLAGGRYALAESLGRSVLSRAELDRGEQSPEAAVALDALVEALFRNEKGGFDETRRLARRAVSIRESQMPPDSLALTMSLLNLARIQEGNEEAEGILKRALELRERILGIESPELADILEELAFQLTDRSEFQRAGVILDRILTILDGKLYPSLETRARTLNAMGYLHHRMSRYPEARSFLEQALALRLEELGPDHPATAETLALLGNTLQRIGLAHEAESCHRRALSIRMKAFGPGHPRVALSLFGLASTVEGRGDRHGACQLLEQSLKIRERWFGSDHESLIPVLSGLAQATDSLAARQSLLGRGLDISRARLGEEHVTTGRMFVNISGCLEERGRYAAAESLLSRGIRILKLRLGVDHEDVGSSLARMAELHHQLGRLALAQSDIEQASSILRRHLPSEHPRIAETLWIHASILAELGDLDRAEELASRSLAIQEKAYGPRSPRIAGGCIVLAGVQGGDRGKGLYERALTILRDSGDAPDLVGVCLHRLGLIALETGDSIGAIAQMNEALSTTEAARGSDHPAVAAILGSLGRVHLRQREFDAAGKALARCLSIRQSALGGDHPYCASTLALLSLADHGAGRHDSGLARAIAAEAVSRRNLARIVRDLPERQAFVYGESRCRGLDIVLSEAVQEPSSVPAVTAWGEVLASRSLVVKEIGDRMRTAGLAAHVTRLSRDLQESREALSALSFGGEAKTPAEVHRARLEAASAGKERAERRLAAGEARMRRAGMEGPIRLGALPEHLPPGSGLVSYVRYLHYDLHGDPSPERFEESYVAFTLGRGGDVSVVRLGRASEIDSLIDRYRQAMHAPAIGPRGRPLHGGPSSWGDGLWPGAGVALRRRIWDPVAASMAGLDPVLIVPDGQIHLVHLAALPVDTLSYLIDSGQSFHALSSERDLWRDDSGDRGEGLLALGFPVYGSAPSVAGDALGNPIPCLDRRSLAFHELPATRLEIDAVVAGWRAARGSSGETAFCLTGSEATETSFKLLAPGRSTIHLATHGFFLGDCSAAERGDESLLRGNPLLLSGLAMAGANEVHPGDGVDDGLLTAEEISGLDLYGVDCVVLSACGTGIGQVLNGEGVRGLRQAFEIAGAGTVVLSLWPVEDDLARRWMGVFYDTHFAGGKRLIHSVREASLRILNERRRQGLSTHPFYWAAFLSSGDWR